MQVLKYIKLINDEQSNFINFPQIFHFDQFLHVISSEEAIISRHQAISSWLFRVKRQYFEPCQLFRATIISRSQYFEDAFWRMISSRSFEASYFESSDQVNISRRSFEVFIAFLQMKTIPSQTGSEPAAVRRNLKDGYVKLISSDGHVFTLKREYVELSSTLMNMIEDGDTPLISAEMLKFLCVYLTVRHQMRDSWFDVEQHEHGSLIEISEKIVNGKVEPKITLNEATDYGIVRRSVLAKAGADPLKLLEAMQYYGLCTDLLPHERYWKHKDNDKRGAPFIAEDFHMIEFKTCTPTNVPQRFLGVELIVRVDEYAIESFRELMPNLHSKCRAGDKVPSLNDLCEREAKNWQVRMQNFINMCRALETRQFVKQARYECTQCSTGYGSKYPLANHFKKKHMTVESSDEEVEEAPPVKKPKRECPKHKCPVQSCTTSPSTEHLTRHLKSGLPGHGYTDDQVKTAKQQMGIRMKSSRKRLFED